MPLLVTTAVKLPTADGLVVKVTVSAVAVAAVTVPTALFLFTVWLVHARRAKRTVPQKLILPVGAAVTLACTFAGSVAVPLVGLVAAAQVAVGVFLKDRTD